MTIKESVKINADLLLKDYQKTKKKAFDIALKMEELTLLQTKIGSVLPENKPQKMYGLKDNPQGRPISPCGPRGCGPRVVQRPVQEGEAYSTEGCVE